MTVLRPLNVDIDAEIRELPLVTEDGLELGLDLVDVDIVFVGAHPDDDSGVLATFARYLLDEGFRGTVVTATGVGSVPSSPTR